MNNAVTISNKLSTVNESFTVYMYDNGFMFEIGGRDTTGEYKTTKILCNTIDHLLALVQEATTFEKDE